MAKLFTANRETGTVIDEVSSVTEGKKLIENYERDDKSDGVYKRNSYDVVDFEGRSVL